MASNTDQLIKPVIPTQPPSASNQPSGSNISPLQENTDKKLNDVTNKNSNKKKIWIFLAVFLTIILSILVLTFIYLGGLRFFSINPSVPEQVSQPSPRNDNGSNIATMEQVISKTNKREDLPLIFNDINSYFATINKQSISSQPISRIDGATLLEKLESGNEKLVVIDLREKREYEELIRLNEYPSLRYIRFGDLINDNHDQIPLDSEIILVAFTENREIAASSYIKLKGYSNVSILQGGLLQWSVDGLPTVLNTFKMGKDNSVIHSHVSSLIDYFPEDDVEKMQPKPTVLEFKEFSQTSVSISIWDSKKLSDYINSLPKDQSYILLCHLEKYCYDAAYFWYEAKDVVNIIGFTGDYVHEY